MVDPLRLIHPTFEKYYEQHEHKPGISADAGNGGTG